MNNNNNSRAAVGRKQLLVLLLLALTSVLVTLTAYAPSLIYFAQREYFAEYFLSLIQLPFLYGAAAVILIMALLALMPKWLLKFLASLLVLVALLLWLQVDIFAVSYGVLDGAALNFEHYESRGQIELVVILVALLLSIIAHKFIIKNGLFVVGLVLLGQLVLILFNVLQEPNDKASLKAIDKEFHQYSAEKNVLIIILDTFGSEYFQQLLAKQPELLKQYPGFVSYTDAISNYSATKGSLPSMLSGHMIPENMKLEDFYVDVLQPHGLPNKYHHKGYEVSVMSTTNRLSHSYPDRNMSELPIDPDILHRYHAFQLFDYALFRSAIHAYKPMIFDEGKWFLSKRLAAQTKIPNTPSENGKMLLESLAQQAVVADEKPRFKVIHATIPHPEYVYDQTCQHNDKIAKWPIEQKMLEQSACALTQLNQLLDAYKSLGIYDNSVIVVTSDHGARVFNQHHINGFPSQFELNASGILFMIKGVNQKAPYREVDQPFSLLKLSAALADPNQHTSDYSQLQDDERMFYAYWNWHDSEKGYLADAPLYQVTADYKNTESWHLQEFVVNVCKPESFPLMMTFGTTGREGYCGTFGFNRPAGNGKGSWTVGDDSRIVFNLADEVLAAEVTRTVELKFMASNVSTRKELELSVYLNDQLLGVENLNGTNTKTITYEFPNSWLKGEKNILQFKLPGVLSAREVHLGKNAVRLGIFLRHVEFN